MSVYQTDPANPTPIHPLTGNIPPYVSPVCLRAEATWDPGSLAPGASGTTTVSLGGTRQGDRVEVAVVPALPEGFRAVGYVSADGTVTITAVNLTGSTYDLPSSVFTVSVWPLFRK